ncbi:MAG: hypothetical protein NTU62_07955 [Spirochaetes bacterium]|nr:hypothetical protein [Spirochaetota bacterium]
MVETRFIVYPEGDTREIAHALRVNELVDLNGGPLGPPLPTARMIVYRIWKITTAAARHDQCVSYHLEQVTRPELDGLCARGG